MTTLRALHTLAEPMGARRSRYPGSVSASNRRPFESACRNCGKPILWAEATRKDGSPCKMPFDPDPTEHGTHALMHPGGDRSRLVARYIKKGEEWPLGSLPRTSHFETCSARKRTRGG